MTQKEFQTVVERALADNGLAPRHMFPPLCPIGIGTGEVESLGSYVWRMAGHLGFSFTALYHYAMPWLARGEPENVGRFFPGGAKHWTARDPDSRYAKGMELATGIVGLDRLTFAPFTRVIGAGWGRPAGQHFYRWCPACLAESPHGRLLWSTPSLSACPVHGTRLAATCAACGSRGGLMYRSKYSPLSCPECGDAYARQPTGTPADANEVERSRSCANLFSVADRLPGERTLQARRIREACDAASCNALTFAKLLGGNPSTVRLWLGGKFIPPVESALSAAEVFQVRLGDFLLGDNGQIRAAPLRDQVPRQSRRSLSPTELGAIRSLLQDADAEASIESIARRFSVSANTLRNKLPAECVEHSKARKARRRRIWMERKARSEDSA